MDITKQTYLRNCPKCNIELTYDWKQSYVRACKNNQTCYKCRKLHWVGKTHSKETKNKMSKSSKRIKTHLGKTFTKEHRQKISRANIGNKSRTGIPHTEDTKKLMKSRWVGKVHPNSLPENREKFRKLHHDRVISRCGQITPNYNPIACKLFNEINQELGWNGLHAENGGEFKVRGWFLDYYEPNLNIVIEYDENHHTRTKRKEKDIIKESEVIESLGCKFYRIKQGEEMLWRSIIK